MNMNRFRSLAIGTLMLVWGTLLWAQGTPIPVKKARKIRISTVKEIKTDYFLVEEGGYAEFEAKGPAYIRIYTRLIYEGIEPGPATYKMILSRDDEEERIIRKETEPSERSTYRGVPVGKWRSILVEVPPGRHVYRLFLLSAPSGKIAVRVVPARPPRWTEVLPLGAPEELKAVEDERVVTYYLLQSGKPIRVRVNGPGRIKIIARLNFSPDMGDEAAFTLSVREGGREIRRESFTTYRSQVVRYENATDWVPSRAESFYLRVPEGTHTYELALLGTFAPSAAVRVLKLEEGSGR